MNDWILWMNIGNGYYMGGEELVNLIDL